MTRPRAAPLAAPRAPGTAVYLELGSQRVFACALEWPGWCRSGKDEVRALEALAAAAPRYAPVAARARVPFPVKDRGFDVMERLPGSATTNFGAPDKVAARDRRPLPHPEAERLALLVAASWSVFDEVVAAAPATLRKGPRGGGRDRDAIVEHVLAAEASYARKLGIRHPQPARGDRAAVLALHRAILEALRAASGPRPAPESGWPLRYAARRITWHVLDHAWEMEDRDPSR